MPAGCSRHETATILLLHLGRARALAACCSTVHFWRQAHLLCILAFSALLISAQLQPGHLQQLDALSLWLPVELSAWHHVTDEKQKHAQAAALHGPAGSWQLCHVEHVDWHLVGVPSGRVAQAGSPQRLSLQGVLEPLSQGTLLALVRQAPGCELVLYLALRSTQAGQAGLMLPCL